MELSSITKTGAAKEEIFSGISIFSEEKLISKSSTTTGRYELLANSISLIVRSLESFSKLSLDSVEIAVSFSELNFMDLMSLTEDRYSC